MAVCFADTDLHNFNLILTVDSHRMVNVSHIHRVTSSITTNISDQPIVAPSFVFATRGALLTQHQLLDAPRVRGPQTSRNHPSQSAIQHHPTILGQGWMYGPTIWLFKTADQPQWRLHLSKCVSGDEPTCASASAKVGISNGQRWKILDDNG